MIGSGMTDREPDGDWFPVPVPAPGRTGYTDLGLRPDATADEVRVATARRIRSLRNAGATQDELAEANAAALTHLDHRAAHDDEHPPCAIMRLRPTWSPIFDDARTALSRARRDLESFLLAQDGDEPIPVPRATDLGHTDFTADFRSSPLLDRKDP
jgi:hypothetical protein